MSKSHKITFSFQNIILILSCFLIGLNCFFYFVHIRAKWFKVQNHIEPGIQFNKFNDVIAQNQKFVGYITNKDLSPDQETDVFLQAQYMLVPRIIVPQEDKYMFNILDFNSESQQQAIFLTLMKMKNLNSLKVAHNEYGQILVQKK